MEKPKVHIKARYIVLIILGALLIAGYVAFVATRFSDQTTYVPFSGRVFNISSEGIEFVRVQHDGNWVDAKNAEDIKELTDYLNSFRYRFWIPDPPVERAGWDYAVELFFNDGTWAWYQFTGSSILVKGVWFFGPRAFFDGLKGYLGTLPVLGGDQPVVPATPWPASPSDLPSLVPSSTGTDIPPR